MRAVARTIVLPLCLLTAIFACASGSEDDTTATTGDDDDADGDRDASDTPPAPSTTSTTPAGKLDGGPDADGSVPTPECTEIVEGEIKPIGDVTKADEFALELTAESASATSWGEIGNEALIVEIHTDTGRFVGHVILHQGKKRFVYGMHVGALASGEKLLARLSPLSSTKGERKALVCGTKLTAAADLGELGEGLQNAPILVWPAGKAFDDAPLFVSWSKAGKNYIHTYTNENGGTPQICGGGATGVEAEIGRWGRAFDVESAYSYATTPPTWQRCKDSGTLRFEAKHPKLYYGDGHNRLFESRGGYGQTCGTAADLRADGNLQGWNSANPGNGEAQDGAFVVVHRPLPAPRDAVRYPVLGADTSRERPVDLAPWLYRLTHLELARENKIDGTLVKPVGSYLYADLHASDVGGDGDKCTGASSGFVLRVKTADNKTHNGLQMTNEFFGDGEHWKRVAVALSGTYTAADVTELTFDAYDNDGIYLVDVGDVFLVKPDGDNGASLDYVRKGALKSTNVYVDDDESGCSGGTNSDGPGGIAYACKKNAFTFTP